jgi:hypothetical protein
MMPFLGTSQKRNPWLFQKEHSISKDVAGLHLYASPTKPSEVTIFGES